MRSLLTSATRSFPQRHRATRARRPGLECLEGRELLTTISIGDATAVEGDPATRFIDAFVPANSGGLSNPHYSLFGPDRSGDGIEDLYVASGNTDEVLLYDGESGAFLSTFVTGGSGGLDSPWAMAFGPDGNLYVAGTFSANVLRYDGTTGDFIDAFVPAGSYGLIIESQKSNARRVEGALRSVP